MKRVKSIILASSFITILCLGITGCGEANKEKTLEKNYGYSNGDVNIGPDGAQVLDVNEIVPSKSELSENLEKAGFAITVHGYALDSDIAAERIYAEKNGKFIDICYGLSVEQATDIFSNYESNYKDYYLMAQNENYVYTVSDEETFKTAEFDTLETNGILFIWK